MGRGQSNKGRRPTLSTSSLGQRIREYRTSLGLTQVQLGAPVYQGGYLSDVEHGRVTPSLEALEPSRSDSGSRLATYSAKPDPRSDPPTRWHALTG